MIFSPHPNIDLAFITGDYARGSDSGLIDLVIIGAEVDQTYLQQLVKKAEKLINRKIRTLVLDQKEFANLKDKLTADKALLVWGTIPISLEKH